ncbi:MAG TPA: serine hydrolase [Vicinamibacterales bacterium]|nr:serine hydrolase [Vicinamibacterales bacterium]
MIVRTLAAVALVASALSPPAAPGISPGRLAAATVSPQALADARHQIDRLAEAANAEVSVVWRPLDARPGEELLIGPTVRYHAASTMKVPVMIELYRQAHDGLLTLDDEVLVTNTFHSIVDGSPYELSASEDSDGETYKAIGKPLSLRTLCETMITASGNLAANVLVERLGAKNIQATVDRLGAGGMQVLRGVEDLKAFDKQINNTTDAAGLATLFERLARGEAVSRDASAEMIGILKRQKHNEGIPAGLPAGIEVAHKTGEITKIHHDAGVVYAKRPYVLVVLTRGIDDQAASGKLIAEVSRVLYSLTDFTPASRAGQDPPASRAEPAATPPRARLSQRHPTPAPS